MALDLLTLGQALAQAKHEDALIRPVGNQKIADMLGAPVLGQPPVITYSAGFSSGGDAAASGIASSVAVAWNDTRLRWLSKQPLVYTPTINAGASLTDMAAVPAFTDVGDQATQMIQTDQFGMFGKDWTGTAFEMKVYANSSADSYFRIWVDGKPHAAQMEKVSTANDHTRTLIKVAFASRKKRTILVELEAAIFGGLRIGPTDELGQPPFGPGGLTVLILGDSYAGVQGVRVTDDYSIRLARRLGAETICVDGWGGTGLLRDNSGHGLKYRDRLTLAIANGVFPTAPHIVLVQGSINDANGIAGGSFTTTQLQTETTALIAALRSQYPRAAIFVTSTVRPKVASSDDATGSGPYAAAVTAAQAADGNVFYVDALTAPAMANGTGNIGSPTGDGIGDFWAQSDNNHPTVEGHTGIGDWVAQKITKQLSATPLQSARYTPGTGARHISVPLYATPAATSASSIWAAATNGSVASNMSMSNGGSGLQNDSFDTYDVWLDAGTWQIDLFSIKAASGGIVTVSLLGPDGTIVCGTQDEYNATTAQQQTTLTGIAVTNPGLYRLRLKVTSKNASSSGFIARVGEAILTRTA